MMSFFKSNYQALPDSAESLCLSEMGGTEGREGEPGVQGQLYLNIGLHNGVLLRTVVDQVGHLISIVLCAVPRRSGDRGPVGHQDPLHRQPARQVVPGLHAGRGGRPRNVVPDLDLVLLQ